MYRSALSGKTSGAANPAQLKLIKLDACPIRAQYIHEPWLRKSAGLHRPGRDGLLRGWRDHHAI
jgi:hypothetical protein